MSNTQPRRRRLTPLFKYQWFLWRVAVPAVSNTTTYGDTLLRHARQWFGRKFHGVYMRDEVPSDLNGRRPYAIINLDDSKDPNGGSHWIAVAWQPAQRALWVYDSFGKMHDVPQELLALYGDIVSPTEPDAEQHVDEKNCGARCLAWLLLAECFPRDAPRI